MNQDVLKFYKKIVFQVMTFERKEIGSSFWIFENYFITANHVVEKNKKIYLRHQNWNKDQFFVGNVISTDNNLDLAIIQCDMENLSKIDLPNNHIIIAKEINLGQNVSWLGYPKLPGENTNIHYRLGSGRICSSIYNNNNNNFEMYEINGEMNSGHSGSPIFDDLTGELVGIVLASVGSLKELDQIRLQIMEILRDVSHPLILNINNPNKSIMQGQTPIGWINIGSNDPHAIPNLINRLQKLFDYYKFPINANQFQVNGNTLNFSPNISQLITMASVYDAVSNLIKAVQISYQLGIGISITPKEIETFISKNIPMD